MDSKQRDTSAGTGANEYTSLRVRVNVRDRLKSLKPYNSMSFNELLVDMAEQYDSRQRETETTH
jgi:hypothetical protein